MNFTHKIVLSLLALFTVSMTAAAQENMAYTEPLPVVYKKIAEKSYRFRISLADKKKSKFTTARPEEFLSAKSLERRRRYGLSVDEHDLPVSPAYLKDIRKTGAKVYNMSKWNNTVVVQTAADTSCLAAIRRLPFVTGIRMVWESPDSLRVRPEQNRHELVTNTRDTILTNHYGWAKNQVEMLRTDSLHNAGYRGKGITIGVIDGGFYNADLIKGLPHDRILGTRNFVRPQKSVYEELDHGMMVLSCIAADEPHYLVGTAPDANFYLLVSEDGETEQLVEEDNWCAALEYADSLGCDIVTSSLGYYHFDHPEMNHTYAEQDGKTALNSRSASLAASRGMLVLNSAGNSGDETWKKIGFPADATDIVTVGAVDAGGMNTPFSSIGNSADGRVKPDVMAQGLSSSVFDDDGTVVCVNGTSFSCPILCGATACLMQMYPNRRPQEIIAALQKSGSYATAPNNIFGYGIPNMARAAELLK